MHVQPPFLYSATNTIATPPSARTTLGTKPTFEADEPVVVGFGVPVALGIPVLFVVVLLGGSMLVGIVTIVVSVDAR